MTNCKEWIDFQAFFDRSRHSFQSVLDFYRYIFIGWVAVPAPQKPKCWNFPDSPTLQWLRLRFILWCENMIATRDYIIIFHICQQNCALIVQADLHYWGLDDVHLQAWNNSKVFWKSVVSIKNIFYVAMLHKQILPHTESARHEIEEEVRKRSRS